MSIRKLTETVQSLFSSKTDAQAPSNSLLPQSSASLVDSSVTTTPTGKSFRDYVKSTTEQTGNQKLGDIALTESYGSAFAAQIIAARTEDVKQIQTEVEKRQTAFDRDLKQVMTENGLDATTIPTLDVNERGRITVTNYKDANKLETILNSTPGVAEALDALSTAKVALAQLQAQAAGAVNTGPSFSVSFDGARAQLAAEKSVASLGSNGAVAPANKTEA
ncbi:MAG: hypothetical protein ACOVQ8_03845 [Elstera sp.]